MPRHRTGRGVFHLEPHMDIITTGLAAFGMGVAVTLLVLKMLGRL